MDGADKKRRRDEDRQSKESGFPLLMSQLLSSLFGRGRGCGSILDILGHYNYHIPIESPILQLFDLDLADTPACFF